jgi:hypothetical protein
MLTKLLNLVEILASRGVITSRTKYAPGAIAAQWNRYFDLKSEDDDEGKIEEINRADETEVEILVGSNNDITKQNSEPIADPGVVKARKFVISEYLRSLTQDPSSSRLSRGPNTISESVQTSSSIDANTQSERIIQNPDLRVPSGDASYIYLPQ